MLSTIIEIIILVICIIWFIVLIIGKNKEHLQDKLMNLTIVIAVILLILIATLIVVYINEPPVIQETYLRCLEV